MQVKAVYLDRGFYNSTCLELLYAHNYAYVMPIVKCGETSQDALSSSWSRVIEHELVGQDHSPLKNPEWVNLCYTRCASRITRSQQ